MSAVFGLDLSHWNGNWDANKARAAGVAFVFVKASQALWTDSFFIKHWHQARRAGILRSAYHYLDYTKPPRQQANYFADLLDANPGELPPVVDYEQTPDSKTTISPLNYLREFVEQLRARSYDPIIYTSPAFWKSYGSTDAYWAHYPLWIAHYTTQAKPSVLAPWKHWTFWQFTAKGDGTKYGTDSFNVDLNRFNGTLEQLQAMSTNYNPSLDLDRRVSGIERRLTALETSVGELLSRLGQGTPPEEPPVPAEPPTEPPSSPPPTTTVTYGVCIADYALTVRSGPGVTFPPVDYLRNGQRVRVLEQKDGWARLESPAGWSSLRYLRLETVEEPLPEVPEEDVRSEPPDAEKSGDLPVPPDEPGLYAFCTVDLAEVRSGPSTGYAVTGNLKPDQAVRILERKGDWVHVDAPNGWVPLSVLRTVTDAVVLARNLSVRRGPGSNHPAEDWLVYGQKAKVIEIEGDWTFLHVPGGWCLDAHLQRQYSATETEYALAITRDLEVRARPDGSADLVTRLAFGQRVRVVEKQDGWARIEGPTGWCYNRYLKYTGG